MPPTTRAELIEALTRLPDLDPVERARVTPALQTAATVILAAERAAAMREATRHVSQAELARQLGVTRSAVSQVIGQGRKESSP